ncbi:hypothetical protein [uncultured Psychroserpens sp.]|uniref:hypothetical protein n=1 Tax=uncultured Psychroserpens sp. TaxID=255436 RepID=UPI002615309F|nr:hypothetical protein [uncultured Psychroserpens sp.]
MKNKMSQSINIIRDDNRKFDYYVTPNAKKTANEIFENFNRGIHSFNLIGSFGTGKSSFLWALEKSLKDNRDYFNTAFNGKTEFVKLVGDYQSLKSALNEEFNITEDFSSNQKLFDAIFQRYEKLTKKKGLLIITIDEFGKFLEFAAKNNPEDEVYFIQKLAEFVNSPDRNIILLTSLHQSIESYGYALNKKEIQEWRKIKGRFKDLTFNEPIEQLLFLATSYLSKRENRKESTSNNSKLIAEFNLFNIKSDYLEKIENQLSPLSAISGYTLAIALQRYGQNERSLFTFLNSIKFSEIEHLDSGFEIAEIYDYLFEEFYNFIISKSNPDYSNWSAIKDAIERAEIIPDIDVKLSDKLIKSLGILSIFSRKGSRINDKFFNNYFKESYSENQISEVIRLLKNHQIIRFSNFDSSYKLAEGTDLDIDKAIMEAENQIDDSIDVLSKLNSHFDFPIITAKSITYKLGTPRLFEFQLTNILSSEKPLNEIDGFINLIFNEKKIAAKEVLEFSKNKPTLYGIFLNTSGIFETLFEIEKTNKVLKNVQNENDRVAIKELKSIINSQEKLLNHYVMDSLYSNRVTWYANGKELKIRDKKEFNKALSSLCADIYNQTPRIQNELINRHKVSGSIAHARKNFWKALVNHYQKQDLGFDNTKWPAEKTIYYTLLKQTGVHTKSDGYYTFTRPNTRDFIQLWDISNSFLDEAKSSRKSLLDFINLLSSAPIKLKQGVIDFWIPTFLFIKRGDFALYGDNGFIPYLDENILYMMTRNPKEYSIKSFELNKLRLNLFNKYRDFLRQDNRSTLDTDSFIESIRPVLIFYRDLEEYSKNTKTISPEAVKLREAISKAKDPEKTFFEDFPSSLGYTLKELSSSNKVFENYIIDFQNKIQEIKGSFEDLLNRFELFICNEIVGKKVDFKTYKSILQKRFESIKEHEALTKHKIFLLRVQSQLDDRNSYLMSICQALIGKPLNQIKDSDEKQLMEKMASIVKELDNLVDLNKVKVDEGELLIKFELTTKNDGGKEQIVRIPKNKREELDKKVEDISSQLDKNESLKIPILVSLLKKALEKQ